ncbi:MAG: carboxypeptidase-like regulatory domain-containing protein, partial [Tannerella sp.]|nr:carboxypeptidase-like regulatory domain-containing protein [Tannerella sp.]
MIKYKTLCITFFLATLAVGNSYSQNTVFIEGYVKDSITNEALPYVSISIRGTAVGTTTDLDGGYNLKASTDSSVLAVSYLGYETVFVRLKRGINRVNVKMKPLPFALEEVVVQPKREKYTKKDNPAVAFVRNVIDRRNMNEPDKCDYFGYNTYEQRSFAHYDLDMEKSRPNGILYRKFDFMTDYVDSTTVKGKYILPLYNEEIIEDFFYRKSPRTERKTVRAYKREGLIEIVSEDGMKQFVEDAFQDVNIFQDNVELFLNRFVSPLSTIGPNYYKYYLLDTLSMDGETCVDLGFAPFNSESFGFVGHLYVTLDSTYFVKKVDFNIPRHINLNFVSEASISQNYKRTEDGTRILTGNDMSMVFKINDLMAGIYARRVAVYRNHTFDKSEDMTVYAEKSPVVESDGARSRSEEFWDREREGLDGIKRNSVDEMMSRLRKAPLYYWSERALNILINGYVQTSKTNSRFEFGNVNSFISGNALEGLRLKVGGNTTVNLSRRLFLDGYIAYGFDDDRIKGNALAEYSFNRKMNFRQEYPFHYLRAEYKYDINYIGQHYLYTNADNIFLLIKRRDNNLLT